jgi:hypothetical protein
MIWGAAVQGLLVIHRLRLDTATILASHSETEPGRDRCSLEQINNEDRGSGLPLPIV